MSRFAVLACVLWACTPKPDPDPWATCPDLADRYDPTSAPMGDTGVEPCLAASEDNCVLQCGGDVCVVTDTGRGGGVADYCEPCAAIEAFIAGACDECAAGYDEVGQYYRVECFEDFY